MHSRRYLILLTFALIGLLGSLCARAEEEFLLPDQAFRISGTAQGNDAMVVSWDIADGYYLYRNKFRFRGETLGIKVGMPALPAAESKQDEFFGAVEIYRRRVSISIPLQRDPGADATLTLEATSQGCADAGLCYPPHKQTLLIELPRLAEAAASPPATAGGAALRSLSALNKALSGKGASETVDDIPEPEAAFRFDATVEAPDRLRLLWTIAEGTYLYRDRLRISLEGSPDVALGAYELPAAEIKPDSIRPDGSIGDVALYHREIDLQVPLLRSVADPTQVELKVAYQGCAERGICYPPITKTIPLRLPEASAVSLVAAHPSPTPVTTPTSSTSASAPRAKPAVIEPAEQDRIAATLSQGNPWIIVASFFGFGLLLAFTPCVFPMIPILSGIIAGHGTTITTRRAFLLSLVYVLAMALTYSLAGVLAGLFGANLTAAFQNPWIIASFALMFVLLAVSMFGFYELQLPSGLQSRIAALSNRQQGGHLIGVAIMGLLSALIVGPCVAPPLAGALIYIGQTGDGLLGGVALFALSLGMGAPLVAIGTSAGKLLPRAGTWMEAIKAVFGVLLLAVAIVLLERILPPAVAMLLWGLLLICASIYLGAIQPLPHEANGWQKLWKGLGFALLIYGGLMLLGAAAGGRDTVQPLRGLSFGGAGGEAHIGFRRIKTVADLERALASARSAGKPVMLDFYADWCVSCKEMERYTFTDPKVIAALSGFILLQADVTGNDNEDQALMRDHFGIPGPPAILFFGADGEERRPLRVVGFMAAEPFAAQVRRVTG
jgi:thioredoxin:protein disulfide reductase